MQDRERPWLWLSAAASFVVGVLLVMNDSAAGWFLIIMGIVYIGASTRAGRGLAASDPRLRRWGLVGVAMLLIALAIVVGAQAVPASAGPGTSEATPVLTHVLGDPQELEAFLDGVLTAQLDEQHIAGAVVVVSAVTGAGIPQLLETLWQRLRTPIPTGATTS